MQQFPEKLRKRIEERNKNNALRRLPVPKDLVDFSSNDYLGFAKDEQLYERTYRLLVDNAVEMNGATGSRLLSGNHLLYDEVEAKLCEDYDSEAALIFNSGYDANVGFFSSVPQRGDVILYDEYIHASVRDGITMSLAKGYKFRHNDLDDLKSKVKACHAERSRGAEVYLVTESVFSMDGDSPDLDVLSKYCDENRFHLVVDEAHAVGVFGNGMIPRLQLTSNIFARIITFGKAFGCHGAAILGSNTLKSYLVNFARSFIYTTGLPPHSVATIITAHSIYTASETSKQLRENIEHFLQKVKELDLHKQFIASCSAIQCAIISGNDRVKEVSQQLQQKGFDVRPILSPTVPAGQERLRFCLHSYNSEEEIEEVLHLLATFVNQ